MLNYSEHESAQVGRGRRKRMRVLVELSRIVQHQVDQRKRTIVRSWGIEWIVQRLVDQALPLQQQPLVAAPQSLPVLKHDH
jgi:hypothetical protein